MGNFVAEERRGRLRNLISTTSRFVILTFSSYLSATVELGQHQRADLMVLRQVKF